MKSPVLLLSILLALAFPAGGRASASEGQSGQHRPANNERWPESPPQNPNASRPQASTNPRRERAQDRESAIELRSDLVTLTATVTGSRGELVGDLRKEDFEVIEDGKPQALATFGRSEVPLSLVIVFDASLSVRSRLDFEKQAILHFLRATLRPVDQAAILSVSTDILWRQELTQSIEVLAAAVRSISAEGATALYDGIRVAAEKLSACDGRRVVLILSDGRDTISRNTLTEVLRVAQAADVVIYGINSSGTPPSANVRDLAGERALEKLANSTGGEVLFPDRAEELEPAFMRLAGQLRTQYFLGFYSSNEMRDGSFRQLVVRLRRPGTFARARSGYYAPKS
ncbi:MAG: VWA domain-containing protein [Acidobacteria bacterium]|nr:VWA domain-containing protein [Acidobacteriota bacterium]